VKRRNVLDPERVMPHGTPISWTCAICGKIKAAYPGVLPPGWREDLGKHYCGKCGPGHEKRKAGR
jgi:hypothetical protein